MKIVVTAAWLWDGGKLIPDPVIEIADGLILSAAPASECEVPEGASTLNYPGAILAPAFFDIHIHGASGHDVMEATPEALAAVSGFLGSRGTGNFLATTVTAPLDTTLRSLERLSGLIDAAASAEWQGARPVGIHLEGPFLSHAKRGVHPPAHLLAPDIAIFDRMFEAAQGKVRLMTLAPELPGAAELTAHATSRGVRVSLGHSNATSAETHPAIAAGACSATHTFNAMRPLDHREPGILGIVMSDDSLYAELICDGIHVDPALVKLWWRAKGATRAILVTDAMSATGMPDGEYQLGGFPVQVAHEVERRFAHVQAALDDVAQFQQAHAEAIGARFGAVDEAFEHQIVQDAVRGRRVQPSLARQVLEAGGVGLARQRVQQRHHALDHLDRGLVAIGGGAVD